jgi:hypothetical protein
MAFSICALLCFFLSLSAPITSLSARYFSPPFASLYVSASERLVSTKGAKYLLSPRPFRLSFSACHQWLGGAVMQPLSCSSLLTLLPLHRDFVIPVCWPSRAWSCLRATLGSLPLRFLSFSSFLHPPLRPPALQSLAALATHSLPAPPCTTAPKSVATLRSDILSFPSEFSLRAGS